MIKAAHISPKFITVAIVQTVFSLIIKVNPAQAAAVLKMEMERRLGELPELILKEL